jgi:hypothetical protein
VSPVREFGGKHGLLIARHSGQLGSQCSEGSCSEPAQPR